MTIHQILSAALCLTLAAGTVSAQQEPSASGGYPIDPVPFTSVKVTDNFWGQRLKASREVTIPLAFSKCEETGRYTNFTRAAQMMELQNRTKTKPLGNPEHAGCSMPASSIEETCSAAWLLPHLPASQRRKICLQLSDMSSLCCRR